MRRGGGSGLCTSRTVTLVSVFAIFMSLMCACGQAPAPESTIQGMNVSEIVASIRDMGSTGITLDYRLPGTSIATNGGPWPYYKGIFDFHAGTGSLSVPDASAFRLPSPVLWTLSPAGSTLITSNPQPFTAYPDSAGVEGTGSPSASSSPSGTGAATATSSGTFFNERILFSRIRAAGALDPVETYMAVVVNPAFWIDLLASSSKPLGRPVVSTVNGKSANRYDVIFNLDGTAAGTVRSTRAALHWIAGYFGVESVPGQVWLSRTGKLVRIRFIRTLMSSPLPRSASRFPDPASFPSLTLTLLGYTTSGLHGVAGTTETSSSGGGGMALASTKGTSTVLGRSGGPGSRCVPAGHTGLSAAMVARAGQHITGTINATGCDVGVYVGSGLRGVVVSDAVVTGAGAHGIMVVDNSGTVIKDNTVNDSFSNIIDLTLLPEVKSIILIGTTGARVVGNSGAISIGVVDDGAVDAGAVNPGIPSVSTENIVVGNHEGSVIHHLDCVVALAAFNPGEGVIGNIVSGNVFPGGIVVSTDAADTASSGNVVEDNRLEGALLPGVIVHSNAAGDTIRDTVIKGNTLSQDASFPICGLSRPAGIALIAAAGVVSNTTISNNTITSEQVGVWIAGAAGTTLSGNAIVVPAGSISVVHIARPGCNS